MDSLELKPARRAAGTVRLPGSKSISNRVLLLAALAKGETEVLGLLDADDTRVMREALAVLGVSFSGNTVTGVGGPFPVKKAELFLGNAGTAFRPLTAALAFSGGEYRLSGVPRMHERPIGDLVDALRGIGARVDYTGKEGFPPLIIRPSKLSLEKIRVRGDVSSQFLTALLMALPLSGKPARIEVQGELISKPYVEITLNVMKRFGIEVKRTGWRYFDIPAGSYVSPGKVISACSDHDPAKSALISEMIVSKREGLGSRRCEDKHPFVLTMAFVNQVAHSTTRYDARKKNYVTNV